MSSISYRSIQRRAAPDSSVEALPSTLHPVLRRVYAARQLSSDHVMPTLRDLLPIGSLGGIESAAARLAEARRRDERVLILGDFDADGATATALCVSCLRALGFSQVDYLVPNRIEYGYGLSPKIADEAVKRSPDLIVTVDNGISSLEGIERAAQQGIEVIVTDHHLPGRELPAAAAIVNPNLRDEPFASKHLAGVGVAFYLMAAVGRLLGKRGLVDEGKAKGIVADALDLVALGTVADLVKLDFNNRILVAEGLARIRAGKTRPGIRALFSVAGRNMADARAADLGFAIAPRLNAAGRLTDMSLGIDCLLAETDREARARAERLDGINRERRELQSKMESEAREHVVSATQAVGEDDNNAYCLFDPGWHEGVVGLVASRVKEQVRRPVVAFAQAEAAGVLKGSARSVDGIHVRDVIDAVASQHPGLVHNFGGHAMAAGLTLDASRLEDFRTAFSAEVSSYTDVLSEPDVLWTDGELAPDELNLDVAEMLRGAGPFGQGFPEPLFENVFEVVDSRVLKDAHLKMQLGRPGSDALVDAIAFNQPELPIEPGAGKIRFVYQLDVNEFRNRRTHQLVVEHMQSE